MYRQRRSYLLYFCNHAVFALACINNHMCAILLGHSKSFISGVDTNNIETECSCELDTEMSKATSRPNQGNPLAALKVSCQYTIPDCSSSTCKWCCALECHLIWDGRGGSGIHKCILRKETISVYT